MAFNSREIAALIWLGAAAVWLLAWPKGRGAVAVSRLLRSADRDVAAVRRPPDTRPAFEWHGLWHEQAKRPRKGL